ncbi:sulfur carrier protein ThiS [Emergencia sp.]|uniref:sulfur carrier protein ThiS n=1 Tax=Emergencia sp. TaxID=1926557 RepID=UPI003AF04C72
MVKINGRETDAEGKTLMEYLKETEYPLRRIAVECNGEIVPKTSYETKVICDGDKIEIVSFVGGG